MFISKRTILARVMGLSRWFASRCSNVAETQNWGMPGMTGAAWTKTTRRYGRAAECVDLPLSQAGYDAASITALGIIDWRCVIKLARTALQQPALQQFPPCTRPAKLNPRQDPRPSLQLPQHTILTLRECLVSHLLPLPFNPPKGPTNMQQVASPNGRGTFSHVELIGL